MFQLRCQKQLSEHCWPHRQVIPQLNLLLALEECCFTAGLATRAAGAFGGKEWGTAGPQVPPLNNTDANSNFGSPELLLY